MSGDKAVLIKKLVQQRSEIEYVGLSRHSAWHQEGCVLLESDRGGNPALVAAGYKKRFRKNPSLQRDGRRRLCRRQIASLLYGEGKRRLVHPQERAILDLDQAWLHLLPVDAEWEHLRSSKPPRSNLRRRRRHLLYVARGAAPDPADPDDQSKC